ncbi:MAG: peptide/nickel transport system ATP-binding protein ddpF [Rhodospirillaceae bacterium]|nr:peptide/nickel transport system ATP-binding protein ddpF [Rhodospirillaceae bacterium]
MSEAPFLSVEDLAVEFQTSHGPVAAVRGVSFAMRRGEVLGIVGESGSGKTVACRSVMRLLAENARIVSGRIRFEGRDMLALDEAELGKLRGERVAMIFQNPSTHLDPLMPVGLQVSEALRAHHGLDAKAARRQAIELLADMRIPAPERRIDSYPHQLSGGMRQRVMIAGALACRPSLLIADEPTTALDVTVQGQILDLLQQLRRERGLSIILVSHDLGVIAQMCDRVVVMKDGQVVETGTVNEVIEQPREDYTRRLVASQPSLMPPASHPARPEAQPILRLNELRVEFPQSRGVIDWLRRHPPHVVKAVDGISLSIERGGALGIVGESGSGKSTIARAIVGLAPVFSGQILFEDGPVQNLGSDERQRFRRAVQMVFQDPFTSLNPSFTVAQTLTEPLWRHKICRNSDLPARVAELMQKVELSADLLTRRPSQLSGGQRQRVGIARALALEPKLIIADEVTSALDVTIQAQILGLFEKLRKSMNLTLVLISHDLAVVRHLCEHVAVMRHGRLVEFGATEQVFASPRDAYTRELLAAIPRIGRRLTGAQAPSSAS